MNNLLLPIAGKSSRFSNTRPKWMLTHPKDKHFMVISAIRGLNLDDFDKIYIGYLKEHQEKYMFLDGLMSDLKKIGISYKTVLVELEQPTKSQSETVYEIIKTANVQGYIFIKDCDNYFDGKITFDHNQICYGKLEDYNRINPGNKAYIELDDYNFISNIVEKKIISNSFSVGGYGFKDPHMFCEYYEKLNTYQNSNECYISNIIFEMIIRCEKFIATSVNNYLDWGTLEDWLEYKKKFKTIFCDIDGTLITNTSSHFQPYYGEGQPMINNIKKLREVYDTGKTEIILTTSRPHELEELTRKELEKYSIPFDMLIMDLPHSQRILINDYATSNPYPSCSSINIFRNSDKLDNL